MANPSHLLSFSELGRRLGTALVQRLLNDLIIPLEILSHLLDPFRVFIVVSFGDKSDAVGAIPNDQLVISLHAEPHLAVEGDPGARSGLLRQDDSDFGRFRQDYGPEGERVRTDLREGYHI